MVGMVKNISGTSDNTLQCDCDSWLEHWESNAGESLIRCFADNCLKPVEVGAHVQKFGSEDRSWYIIPFCRGHNAISPETEIKLKKDYKLIPAILQPSCKNYNAISVETKN